MLRTLPALLLALPACTSPGDDTTTDASTLSTSDMSEGTASTGGSTGDAPTTGDSSSSGGDLPGLTLDAPCTIDAIAPTRLAVITNDFVDPAKLHVVDLATRTLTPDLAPAPSDPALAWGDGKLVVLGRFGINTLDIYDG
ncbi:MAG TPA: hypothetical protein VGB85_31080, partial [Nannocystis sp.]